jgi:diadenosine tetraphosphate (Ap4A) HIT family hydrolase
VRSSKLIVFPGARRREVLNAEWFATTRQAETVITQWLRQYNHIRPHHALGMRPPVPETILEKREQGCAFCEIERSRIVASNALCFAIEDKYPVTQHHTLIMPKRHVVDYFDLHQPELNAITSLLNETKKRIEQTDSSVEGFNIGTNSGEVGGQTIFHCHVHLIPRRRGDVENPRGGIRAVIPGKQSY